MRSRKTLGMILAVIGCVLPLFTYAAAKYAMKIDSSHGGPPNQGAMVQAGFVVVASIIIGFLVIAAGVYFLVRPVNRSS